MLQAAIVGAHLEGTQGAFLDLIDALARDAELRGGFGERVRAQIAQPEAIGDDGAVAWVEEQHDRAHVARDEAAGCLLLDGGGVAIRNALAVAALVAWRVKRDNRARLIGCVAQARRRADGVL